MEVRVRSCPWLVLLLIVMHVTYADASASSPDTDDEETDIISTSEMRGQPAIRSQVSGTSDPNNTHLRLADIIQSEVTRGRLEIYHDGQWGAVCKDRFDDVAATVACRQLGYETGWVSDGRSVPHGSGIIWLDEVTCSGNESHLLDCGRNDWGRHDCTHRDDVTIECGFIKDYGDLYHEGDIRLADTQLRSEEIHGRLEIFHNGEWGTICDRNPTCLLEVACRQLGYASGRQMYSPVGVGLRVWVGDLHCCGRKTVAECDHSGWGRHRCTHFQDLGLACFGLLNGSSLAGNTAERKLGAGATVVLLFILTLLAKTRHMV